MTARTAPGTVVRRRHRLAGTGLAVLLTTAVAAGVVWRLQATGSHPAVKTVASVNDAAALPALAGAAQASTARPPIGVAAPSPQLWLVSSPQQAAQLQQSLAADDAVRAGAGVSSITIEVMPVVTPAQAEFALHDVDIANVARAAEGRPQIQLVDLR